MAFTMHSHSGQFCPGHAKDQLEDVIKHAITVGYKTIGLTEHMPRTALEDLYPEEVIHSLTHSPHQPSQQNQLTHPQLTPDPHASLASLMPRHESYLAEAQRLQTKYALQIHILIGFEGEWIRPSCGALIRELCRPPCIDYFLGSIHHTAGIGIDFDKAMYARAREAAGGTEEKLFERYYDEQFEMLGDLEPRVVGHFDLVRLLSEEPGRELKGWMGGGVWERVVRNLRFVARYGGWLECNTSALRKGLEEPYPGREIAEVGFFLLWWWWRCYVLTECRNFLNWEGSSPSRMIAMGLPRWLRTMGGDWITLRVWG